MSIWERLNRYARKMRRGEPTTMPEVHSADGVLFAHYSDFPMDQWRWPNFTPKELRCKGTNTLRVDFDAMDKLQALRNDVNVPLNIVSAFRSVTHNNAVGGAKRSKHLEAKAYDIRVDGRYIDREILLAAAKRAGFLGFGTYATFVHVDTGPARTWKG
jgi:zinc D-Ala-D-Ala carboxypeptidase